MGIKRISVIAISIFILINTMCFMKYRKVGAFDIYKKVEKIVDSMTIEEKIGQMLMLDFRQWQTNGNKKENLTELNEEVAKVIEQYNLGGIILFSENINNIEQTTKLIYDIQQVVNESIPMLIALDQEGGIVNRLKYGTSLPGNMALGATRDSKSAYNLGYIIGRELNALGINVDFAPVLDVNNNPKNPVIGVRSISSNPDLVGLLGSEIIRGIQSQGIVATAKHFPGHGDTYIDTHYGLPVVNKTLEQLKELELKPFKKAINEGVDMIMTAHIQFPKIEGNTFQSKFDNSNLYLPATLSKSIITNLLRDEMDFEGVVITDAMNMKAISDHFGEIEACKLAIKAGVDIVLMPTTLRCNEDIEKLDKIFKSLILSVNNNEIKEKQIDEAVSRIIKLKIKRGLFVDKENTLLNEKIHNAKRVVGCKEHKLLERQISEQAITVVKNEENILPLKIKKGENILIISPTESQLQGMKISINSLVNENKINKPIITSYVYNKIGNIDEELKAKIEAAQYIITASQFNSLSNSKANSWTYSLPEKVIKLSNKLQKPNILISLKNPYDIGIYTNAKVKVLAYGSKGIDPTESYVKSEALGTPNIVAVMGVIFGTVNPQGKLPVDIPFISDDGKMDINTIYYPYGYGITDLDIKRKTNTIN